MEAAVQADRRGLSKNTSVGALSAEQTTGEVPLEAGVQLRVRFRLEGGLVEAFSRGAWQTAYEVHDTSLRLLYWVTVKKKGAVLKAQLAEPAKFLKKATLYWTRNPDLTDNVTNRIWAMVIDEEKVPHFFDSEPKLKEFLFTFDRRVLVPAVAVSGTSRGLEVEVKVKWGRHSFIEKGHASATSASLTIRK